MNIGAQVKIGDSSCVSKIVYHLFYFYYFLNQETIISFYRGNGIVPFLNCRALYTKKLYFNHLYKDTSQRVLTLVYHSLKKIVEDEGEIFSQTIYFERLTELNRNSFKTYMTTICLLLLVVR